MDNRVSSKICSFCGKRGSRKNRLAGGLGAMICLDCIKHYHEVMTSPPKAAAASKAVWDEMSDAEMLSTLPLILKSAAQNSEFANEWVALIRARRISWAAIGHALGVSRQAVWERFGKGQAEQSSKHAGGA